VVALWLLAAGAALVALAGGRAVAAGHRGRRPRRGRSSRHRHRGAERVRCGGRAREADGAADQVPAVRLPSLDRPEQRIEATMQTPPYAA
jgi:hypothetical protein